MYVGPRHPNNYKAPLMSKAPTVFRAELRAVVHAVMCIAVLSLCARIVKVYTICAMLFLTIKDTITSTTTQIYCIILTHYTEAAHSAE